MGSNTQKPLKQLKETVGKARREFYPYTVPEAILGGDGTTLGDTLGRLPSTYIRQTEKGEADGVATLGADGRIPETQMPRGYAEAKETFLTKQEAGKTYLTKEDAGDTYLDKTGADNRYALKTEIPDTPDLSGYLTKTAADGTYAKKIDIPALPDLSGYMTKTDAEERYALKTDIPDSTDTPTDTGEFIYKQSIYIDSVNGDDDNDGSQSLPIKSYVGFNKALKSTFVNLYVKYNESNPADLSGANIDTLVLRIGSSSITEDVDVTLPDEIVGSKIYIGIKETASLGVCSIRGLSTLLDCSVIDFGSFATIKMYQLSMVVNSKLWFVRNHDFYTTDVFHLYQSEMSYGQHNFTGFGRLTNSKVHFWPLSVKPGANNIQWQSFGSEVTIETDLESVLTITIVGTGTFYSTYDNVSKCYFTSTLSGKQMAAKMPLIS